MLKKHFRIIACMQVDDINIKLYVLNLLIDNAYSFLLVCIHYDPRKHNNFKSHKSRK